MIALAVEDYSNLADNLAQILKFTEQQQTVIQYYVNCIVNFNAKAKQELTDGRD